MRGNVSHQVHEVFKEIIRFGQSKHEAKEQARVKGAKTWHEVGKQLYVYSYATADQYRDIAKEALEYAKEKYGIKNIEKLSSEHIRSYLETKIAQGVKYSTFQKYAAAIEKLETALNKKDREVPLPKETYQALKSLLSKSDKSDGKYKFNMDEYRKVLKESALKSSQDYTGSHGLRWNFAQEKFAQLTKEGKTYEQSLQIVSNLLGHERADITEHYLR